ncbi:hypothetical protein GGI25_004227 [Coemansia spiralis]|uniref:Protein kinase domain-containing protein n=1 Tax=Coemansia spiralis TaxID=417178 RepID=A0A9W8G5H4_9FUNG|nr:hypothetical protein GGI26_005831 [Coemansia sp. RSA 1358]KAJ2674764.1 hypothetical protein GGI25_004227 [Coemansia spiralis]
MTLDINWYKIRLNFSTMVIAALCKQVHGDVFREVEKELGPLAVKRAVNFSFKRYSILVTDQNERKLLLKIFEPKENNIDLMNNEADILDILSEVSECLSILEIGGDEHLLLEDASQGKITDYLKNNEMKKSWPMQLAQAITCIHAMGWFHGDVSHNNILVGKFGNLVLCDYTSSGRIGEDERGKATYGYEDPYISTPEASDIYAVGVAIWVMFNKVAAPINERYKINGVMEDGVLDAVVDKKIPHTEMEFFMRKLDNCEDYKDIILRMISLPINRPSIITVTEFCSNHQY